MENLNHTLQVKNKTAIPNCCEAHFGALGAFSMPNLLLLAGNGRNVGKTFLACKIIRHFSQKEEVVGLKISSHFHAFNESDLIFKNDRFIITDEKQINTKDSSLMLQAGAKRVFFVMVEKENLEEAFEYLKNQLSEKTVICESGGLHEFVIPGLFLFVKRTGDEIVKTHLIEYSPIIVNNDGENFDFDIQNIVLQNHKFSLKNKKWERLTKY